MEEIDERYISNTFQIFEKLINGKPSNQDQNNIKSSKQDHSLLENLIQKNEEEKEAIQRHVGN